MTSRDMTKAEIAAINGMVDGDLGPLADMLQTETDGIHPIVQRYLYRMIRGSLEESDYRINVDRHPELRDLRQGKRAKLKAQTKATDIALMMAHHAKFVDGDFDFQGRWESAIETVSEKTGLGRSTIARHWSQHKNFIRFCAARGIVRVPGAT